MATEKLADRNVEDSGQICTASSRLFVQKGVSDAFTNLLRERMGKIRLGLPADAATDMGPQADKAQVDAVSRYLKIGNKEGRAIIGGQKATDVGPNFIQPTIFADVPDTSRINTEEVFGPVLIYHEFDNEKEVIRRANDTECESTKVPMSLEEVSRWAKFSQTDFLHLSSAETSPELFASPGPSKPAVLQLIQPLHTAPMSFLLEDSKVRV